MLLLWTQTTAGDAAATAVVLPFTAQSAADWDGVLSYIGRGCSRDAVWRSPGTEWREHSVATSSALVCTDKDSCHAEAAAAPWLARRCGGSIAVRRSSDNPSPLRAGNVVDAALSRDVGVMSCSADRGGQWLEIDLGEHRLVHPRHYAVRHGWGDGFCRLRNWVLEGAGHGAHSGWHTLSRHTHDESIPHHGFGVASFTLLQRNANTVAEERAKPWVRRLRVRMTGPNSSGRHDLCLGGLEVWGEMHIASS